VLQVNKLKPKAIESFLKTLSVEKVSEILTQLNYARKVADKIEKTTKNYIKNQLEEFEEETFYGDWRIKKYYSTRFDEKRFLKEGTKEEIDFYNEIKNKYRTTTEIQKFG
jgi:tRNA(Ile)-lysidine synthase TilS/MesJ